ncbi:unnamed protein product [Mytilus edulis]|uniref:Uncharacterized protein n=1 Tax=Mytilus edulis TaxID=6550 RepID=A0A8S3VJQ5_MYTED|nr:unnamed protein product [Mytilus edulis]
MHNQPELNAVSVRLYNYLCEDIGSEKIESEFISSGNIAEGLNLPGSDIDIMIRFKTLEVYENKPGDKEDVIILDTENALPGFALLKGSSKMYNQPELKSVSVQLYKFLCDEIVGSEKVIRYKRLYCKLHDDILNDSESAFISSGSSAEDEGDVIILDTENALPGFALLKEADEKEFPKTHNVDGTLTACLANSDIVEIQFDTDDDDDDDDDVDDIFEIHGPISTYDLLHKAFELLNDMEGDEKCELEELKAITSSDKFDVFFKLATGEEDFEQSLELM